MSCFAYPLHCLIVLRVVRRRSQSNKSGPRRQRGRPVSMYCDQQGWPPIEPGELPPQLLSDVAKDAVPTQEPLIDSYEEEVQIPEIYDSYSEKCKVNKRYWLCHGVLRISTTNIGQCTDVCRTENLRVTEMRTARDVVCRRSSFVKCLVFAKHGGDPTPFGTQT